jgi:hypothetical protein
MLYATSKRFLEVFGLGELDDLPTLREMEELLPPPQPEAAGPPQKQSAAPELADEEPEDEPDAESAPELH